jgi:hypothetical protein
VVLGYVRGWWLVGLFIDVTFHDVVKLSIKSGKTFVKAEIYVQITFIYLHKKALSLLHNMPNPLLFWKRLQINSAV